MEVVGSTNFPTHLQKNRKEITTGSQKQRGRKKVWTRLKNGLFGWRIARGTLANSNNAIPITQPKTDSIINGQQLSRWVPEKLPTSNFTMKNIAGKEKGSSKRKFEVGASDQTGGNRNLRW